MSDRPDGAVPGRPPPIRRCPTCRTTPARIVGHGRTICGWCEMALDAVAAGGEPGPAISAMWTALGLPAAEDGGS